jgi:hypothetical protein
MRILALALLLAAAPAAAQDDAHVDAYGDPESAEMVRLARARRLAVDHRITAYQVTAHERLSARFEIGGADRLLFRREMVSRVEWTMDTVRVELIGAREVQPLMQAGVQLPPGTIAAALPSLAFDPVDSEMLFRLEDREILHPLGAGSEAHYRFASGGRTSVRLHDGHQVRLRELRISARRPEERLLNGTFWLDEATHAVVRAAFRVEGRATTSSGVMVLAPEVTGTLNVSIEYGLWDQHWWLPRTLRADGLASVAGRRVPISYERRYREYQVEGDRSAPAPAAQDAVAAERPCRPSSFMSVVLSTAAATDSAWEAHFDRYAARMAGGDTTRADTPAAGEGGAQRRPPCDRAFLVTRAGVDDLVTSPVFAEDPYGDDAGPLADVERRELDRLIRSIPSGEWAAPRPTLHILPIDLLRANRVEGLSLPVRSVLLLGPAELRAELRAGTTGEVGGRLAGIRRGPVLRQELGAYRRLEALGPNAAPFSLGASASALTLGTDDHDYFRGTGAEVRAAPAPSRPQGWEVRLFAERQEAVEARSALTLRRVVDGGFRVRENLAAEPLDQVGATLTMRTARGNDPARLRSRAELELHGESGDRSFVRPLLRLSADRMLVGRLGAAVVGTAGSGFGDVPPQRLWQIGGVSTVRGHGPAALRGESVWLARGELTWGQPRLRLALFGDAGWAGERAELWDARPLRGAGVGLAVLDNLVRLDVARGIGGGSWGVHLRAGGGI